MPTQPQGDYFMFKPCLWERNGVGGALIGSAYLPLLHSQGKMKQCAVWIYIIKLERMGEYFWLKQRYFLLHNSYQCICFLSILKIIDCKLFLYLKMKFSLTKMGLFQVLGLHEFNLTKLCKNSLLIWSDVCLVYGFIDLVCTLFMFCFPDFTVY